MKRAILAILPILAVFGGCASTDTYVAPVTLASRHVLFDRIPGYPTADQMIRVGDWPSTASFYADSETVSYRETVYDIQGVWPSSQDYTYRRFQFLRKGSSSR